MGKITEILEAGQAPGFNTKQLDERDVDRATPRALKSLSTRDENKLIKESGFSANHFKRTWGLLLIGLLTLAFSLLPSAFGQDINQGYVFTATDRVTATKLNNLVSLATINPTFISGKAASVPQSADNFLFYRGGVLYRTPFANMGVNSTNLITDQVEDLQPDPGDFLLTYKVSAGAYRKATLDSLVLTNANLILNRTDETAPAEETYFLLGQDSITGDMTKISRSNYFYQCFNFINWSNLARLSLGDVGGVTWSVNDATTGTNYQTSLDGLVNNTTVYTTNDLSGYVLIMTNGVVARMTMQSLSNSIVAGSKPISFSTSTAASGITAAASVFNTAHGLPGKPTILRACLVNTSTELNYAAGDEVDLFGTARQPSINVFLPPGTVWANASNIGFAANGTFADINIANRSTGALTPITPGKWDLKITAVYIP